jgi:hypothetical protein
VHARHSDAQELGRAGGDRCQHKRRPPKTQGGRRGSEHGFGARGRRSCAPRCRHPGLHGSGVSRSARP